MTWWLDSPPVGRSLRPWAASPAWPGDRENFTAVQASAASRSILVLHPPRDLPMDWGPCLGQRRFRLAELGSLYYRGTRPRREPGSFQGCCSSAKMVSTTPFLGYAHSQSAWATHATYSHALPPTTWHGVLAGDFRKRYRAGAAAKPRSAGLFLLLVSDRQDGRFCVHKPLVSGLSLPTDNARSSSFSEAIANFSFHFHFVFVAENNNSGLRLVFTCPY